MCHRYPYGGSSAECLEECTRGNRRGTSNKRVCSRDIEGQGQGFDGIRRV